MSLEEGTLFEEYDIWRKRSLQGKAYVYIWADGVYFNVRLEEDRLARLAMAFKLLLSAEQHWRRVNAPHY
jgi:transposase-like protein